MQKINREVDQYRLPDWTASVNFKIIIYALTATKHSDNDHELNEVTDLVPVYSGLVLGQPVLGLAWGVFPAPQTSGGTSWPSPLCHCSESDTGPRCPLVWPTKVQGEKSCVFISKSLVMIGNI